MLENEKQIEFTNLFFPKLIKKYSSLLVFRLYTDISFAKITKTMNHSNNFKNDSFFQKLLTKDLNRNFFSKPNFRFLLFDTNS